MSLESTKLGNSARGARAEPLDEQGALERAAERVADTTKEVTSKTLDLFETSSQAKSVGNGYVAVTSTTRVEPAPPPKDSKSGKSAADKSTLKVNNEAIRTSVGDDAAKLEAGATKDNLDVGLKAGGPGSSVKVGTNGIQGGADIGEDIRGNVSVTTGAPSFELKKKKKLAETSHKEVNSDGSTSASTTSLEGPALNVTPGELNVKLTTIERNDEATSADGQKTTVKTRVDLQLPVIQTVRALELDKRLPKLAGKLGRVAGKADKLRLPEIKTVGRLAGRALPVVGNVLAVGTTAARVRDAYRTLADPKASVGDKVADVARAGANAVGVVLPPVALAGELAYGAREIIKTRK